MISICFPYFYFLSFEGKYLEGRVKLQARACGGVHCCHVLMFKLDGASPLRTGFEEADKQEVVRKDDFVMFR